jgi:putative phosphoribosyl transferase
LERFHDRFDAGRRLAEALTHLENRNPCVLGLARGGIEVASEVSKRLHAPLEVLIARKVGAPSHPEYGIGAVAPGGISVYDRDAVSAIGISEEELTAITKREQDEVERRLTVYRGERPLDLHDRCAILCDDGLATGITALAAVRYAKSLQPAWLVFAVPVSSTQGAALISPEVDEFIAIETPPSLYAVGAWYEDFSQTTDEEVLDLLDQNHKRGYAL